MTSCCPTHRADRSASSCIPRARPPTAGSTASTRTGSIRNHGSRDRIIHQQETYGEAITDEGVRLWCTTAQDIDTLASRIKGAGVRLTEEPRNLEWGGRSLSVDDPDGYHITIYREA